jgi:NAD(P)-dependent dehydrogenase (short-subunit alcohol dehydrogenase family)
VNTEERVGDSLAGRHAAVTGGSRGIGAAIVERLLADGAAVAFCSREAKAVDAAAQRFAASYGAERVWGTVADVTDGAALERFAAAAAARFGGIDSLVCNAGIWGPKGAIDRIAMDEWLRAFDVNVHGVVRTLRAFLPLLRRSGRGRIAIVAGGGAYMPYPFISAYAATKSALARLGESIAGELAEEGIPVNMLLPGSVNTRMVDELLAAGREVLGDARYEKVLAQVESGANPPEKAAALAAFLLSDRSAGITGKLLSITDAYEAIPAHVAELQDGDVFTLRRVLPADRGLALENPSANPRRPGGLGLR